VADPARQPLRWLLRGVVGLALAAAAWGVTGVGTFFACFDNNDCARSHVASEYRGRLFDREGRPAPPTALAFRADVYGDDFEGSLTTDGQGRFCVLAIAGGTSPFIAVSGQARGNELVVRSTAPIDPRFRDPGVLDAIRREDRDAGPDNLAFMLTEPESRFYPIAAHEVAKGWDPSTDAAATCQDLGASPPWYRFDDLEHSWQYAILNLAPLVPLGLFVFGVGARLTAWRRRSASLARTAERAFQATCVAALLTALLTLGLWSLL
jgi:hypothetical protein